jgi:HEAT repeat protein
MTAPDAVVLPPSQVAELLQSLVKALRAFQMYLPNNPIYQRAVLNVRSAFGPIWGATDEIVLQVVETDFHWEQEVVYHQLTKSESLAWILYKDGLRTLTFRRGVEADEIARFLAVVNRARFLPADAGDDLLTLLWEEEFLWIAYEFAEPFADGVPERQADPAAASSAEARQAQVQEEAPPKAPGIVDVDEFDSTLYFLDEAEISYVVDEVEKEYSRDVRSGALAALFDIFEVQTDPSVREEISGIIDALFPNLLNKGEFRTVAALLRDLRLIGERAPDLTAAQRERISALEARLSEPAIVRQLVQSLDEAAARPGDEDVSEVLRELRPAALETIMTLVPGVASENVRTLLAGAADRLARADTGEVLRLLRSANGEVLPGIIAVCGRLALGGAVPGLGDALGHADPAVRLGAVQALAAIGSPGALAHIDRAIDDDDRGVRLAAVRVAGARGYKNAMRRIEAVVQGKAMKGMDLSEKMAFFEAYGSIAGASGIRTLAAMLQGRGLLRMKETPETRACAAMALGKIRTPEARALLEEAATDKDLVVRNAVNRALRELVG